MRYRYIEKKIFKWEVAGFFWIIVAGFLLHSLYQWSNNSVIIGMIAPVNESLWENLKIGYWPLIPFLLIEYIFIGRYVKNFFISKAIGIVVMELFIIGIFYAYMSVTQKPILFIDIGSFILGAILCQTISYRMLKRNKLSRYNGLGKMILVGIGILFILFTFYPPTLSLFRERKTGKYGID